MIDVVVPVHNQVMLVAQCIYGLSTQRDIGQIIVVDDASTTDEIAAFCDTNRRVRYVRLDENVGFVGAVNTGMERATTEYAVIVNSDTSPSGSNSLSGLVYAAHEQNMHVGGAKLLFMGGSRYGRRGTIQHAGIAFDYEGIPYHPFMHLHRRTKAANIVRRVNAVTGAVMAVRLDVWRSIGGFDSEFAPGVFEDVDFCLKAGKVVYSPHSEWLHMMHGSQTDEHDLFDNMKDHLDKLLRRWKPSSDEELFYGA